MGLSGHGVRLPSGPVVMPTRTELTGQGTPSNPAPNFERSVVSNRPLLLFAIVATLAAETASAGYGEYILLNNRANRAVLEDDGDPSNNIIQIRSTNGSFATIQFEQPTHELVLMLGGGNDSLLVDGASLPGFTATIFVLGEGGNDRTLVNNLATSGNIVSDDYEGNNSLVLRNTSANEVFVNDGAGRQRVAIVGQGPGVGFFQPTINGGVYVSSSDGGGSVTVGSGFQFANVGGGVFVESPGYGNDTYRFAGAVGGDVYLNNGFGDVAFDMNLSLVVGSVSVLSDGGVTESTIRASAVTGEIFLNSLEGSTSNSLRYVAVGGAVNIQNGLGYDVLDLVSVQTPTVNVVNGDGGSLLLASDPAFGGPIATLNIGLLNVQNGYGSDDLVFDLNNTNNVASLGDVLFSKWGGNSTLAINSTSGASIGSLRHFGDFDFHDTRLTGVTIANDLVLTSLAGDCNVELNDVRVGGLTDVQAQSSSVASYMRTTDSFFGGPAYFIFGSGDDTHTAKSSIFASDYVADGGAGYDIYETDNNNTFGGIEYVVNFEFQYDIPGEEPELPELEIE